MQEIFGEAEIENNRLTAYYDKDWNPCFRENAAYVMVLDFQVTAVQKEGTLTFSKISGKCIVSQREICSDTKSYLVSLRATLRQSLDVILLGEMRDYETIQTAMTAAETGHLVLSSLHTIGAANTIGRIMDVFEPSQQRQVAIQLSMILQAVIS